ncbi:sulfatase-like hydrolase/transferase [Natronomonas sp. F2-12]|uniref:Sulfatase-like hydrolase/transferase n=1 Tax=Natronomonas aquatica TaxID=2841590 RepID=A0A9R1CQE2_9EURY|nr:sulfatase-like hydrolase/transferase [Natronomonas aquatica]MCQ4333143.1 sulfatase-like hydrolase/transferase [Natronomonas aquatica]
MLGSLTDCMSVSNILIFISDSLRYDAFPDKIKKRTTWGKAVSASTYTGSGFPSIVTGQYPTSHCIWKLSGQLESEPPLLSLYESSGLDVTHAWSTTEDPAQKPPMRMTHQARYTLLEDVSPPFSLVVHDRGGHMTYGRFEQNEWESHDEFFDELANRPEQIKELYHEGVDESAERFLGMYDQLESQGILDDTLVIFTSDHGELLGEYNGLYDHQTPIVPELVYVPLAFAGAGLPENHKLETLASTVDIVPTAFTALEEVNSRPVDGLDLWSLPESHSGERVIRSEIWNSPRPFLEYKATSVWNDTGGIVKHYGNAASRLLYMLGTQYYYRPYSNIVWKPSWELGQLLKLYAKSTVEFGDPPTDISDELQVEFTQQNEANAQTEVPEPTEQQLKDLGYLK